MKVFRRPHEKTPSERTFDRLMVLVAAVVFLSRPAMTFGFTAIPFMILCVSGWFVCGWGLVRTWREADNQVLRITSTILLLATGGLILGLLQTNGWQTLLNTNPID